MIAGCARAQSPAAEGSLQRLVDETGVPALAGAVVTPEGLPLLEAAGLRRRNASETVTTGDLWHLGSNTKAMTAALYGRLLDLAPDLAPTILRFAFGRHPTAAWAVRLSRQHDPVPGQWLLTAAAGARR
jgi:hypothetical protein